MGMQQQTPSRPKSPWIRYAPFIAVVVVIAIIVAIAVAVKGGDDNKDKAVNVTGGTTNPNAASTVPIFYNDAKAKGELDKYTWQTHCDTATGLLAMPILNPPPCVPQGNAADNGGATSPGVTADTIKIGYYIAKPDPIGDGLLKLTGSYDSPDATAKAIKSYEALYASLYELYGRKVELVRIDGTGGTSDAVAARADADRAAAAGVFAMLGGPAQAKQFSDELAQKHVLCIGSCIIAQPQKYYTDHSPYLWPTGPSPDQTSSMVAELVQKQLVGKPAQYGGPDVNGKKRTFTLLTYDTPDGQFKSSWDDLEAKIKATGADVVDHVSYYLNLAGGTLEADARTTAAKLESKKATTLIFTGDPLFPKYLTADMTKDGYFPEWVMSGTVYADTNVFARSFDQEQWKHAFGLQLIPARLPKDKQDAFTVHKWWYGTDPPTENNYGIVKGDMELLFAGLELAGPKLSSETFKAGLYALPPAVSGDAPTKRTLLTYGDHGFWPGLKEDPAGLDNAGILFWDPNASGQDETGAEGKGMYRLVDGGSRYVSGHWPTDPVPLFDPTNTITIYGEDNIPPELLPADIPVPPDAPVNKG